MRCYTCDEIGHFSKGFPNNKVHSHKNKGNKRIHHAHAAKDDEPSKKTLEEISTQNGPFKFNSNSMSSFVSQWNCFKFEIPYRS